MLPQHLFLPSLPLVSAFAFPLRQLAFSLPLVSALLASFCVPLSVFHNVAVLSLLFLTRQILLQL